MDLPGIGEVASLPWEDGAAIERAAHVAAENDGEPQADDSAEPQYDGPRNLSVDEAAAQAAENIDAEPASSGREPEDETAAEGDDDGDNDDAPSDEPLDWSDLKQQLKAAGLSMNMKVTFKDGTQEKLSNAISGGMRMRDYTSKTQQLAVERKEAKRILDDYGVVLKHLERTQPDLADAAREEHERLTQAQREQKLAAQNQMTQQYVQDRFDGDFDAATKAVSAAAKAAMKNYGVSPEDILSIDRPGLFDMIHDAAEYRRLLKEQGEVKSKVVRPDSTRVIRPKAKSRYGRGHNALRSQYDAAMAKLKRTGDPRDAAAAAAIMVEMGRG